MENSGDEFCFNEEKARKCVYYLLKDDIPSFKKFLPEIKAMDSISFENLFQGTPFKNKNEIENEEEGYDYKVKNKNKFEKLLDKFDNFSIILEDWHLDEKYYKYLKELWIQYISIENLKERDEQKLEEILKSNRIDYINWPEDIKNNFKMKINNTSNTRIMALKSILENDLSEFNDVIQKLNYYKKKLSEKKEEENEIYKENATNIIKQILGVAVVFAIGEAFNRGLKAVDAKQIKALKKIILNNNKAGFNQSKVNSLVNRLLELSEGDSGFRTFTLSETNIDGTIKNIKDCHWCRGFSFLEEGGDIEVNCYDGKISCLNLGQKVKTILKNKAVLGIHVALSFLNLGWSIIQLKSTCDSCKQVDQYKNRLDEITKDFENHKNALGILPDDFKESSKKIKEILILIWEDYKKIQKLIDDINKSIHFQEERQKEAILGTAASVVLGTAGVVGSVMTCNVTSAIYTASTVGNVIAGVNHVSSFIVSKKIVKELKVILTKAEKQSQEIQGQIDNLLKKIKNTGGAGEIPKFNLSESYSSISTNE